MINFAAHLFSDKVLPKSSYDWGGWGKGKRKINISKSLLTGSKELRTQIYL